MADVIRRAWPEGNPLTAPAAAEGRAEGQYEDLSLRVLALEPKTDAQRALQAQSLKLVGETGRMRQLLFAQERGTSIPTPFLVVLTLWLTFILASFGLLAPGNPTAAPSLAVCALSVASAVFLILELDHPFHGITEISAEPLRVALRQLGR